MRDDGVILIEDDLTSVKVSKTDATGSKELAGAEISIYEVLVDADGNKTRAEKAADSWTSEEGKVHEVKGLKTGTEYVMVETVAPDGYTIATDTTFTIDETGKVTVSGDQAEMRDDGVILIEDDLTKVTISKTDIASGDELEGAEIVIRNSEGKVVESWTSTTEPHVIEGLKTGEEYTLEETTAPDGYKVTAKTTFTIDEHGKVTTTGTKTVNKDTGEEVLLVQDEMTKISVSKTDIASGDEIAGAHIQIIKKVEKDGKITEEVVEEWDSTTEAHVVTGLTTGVQYILRETVAPDGYTVTSDTTFSIDATGKVFAQGTTTTDDSGNTVLLVEDAKTSIKVSKVDVTNDKELAGATIIIQDADGQTVAQWTSSDKPHVVEGLKTGVEYTLKETVAPAGYTIATETRFSINADGKINLIEGVMDNDTGAILIEDALTVVNVDKIDFATKAKLSGAHIKLLDADGKLVEEWDSNASAAHEITGLTTGVVYTLKETVAPKGFNTLPFDITFTINADGSVTLVKYQDDAGNHYAVTSVKDGVTTISLEDDADLIGKKDDEENGGKKQDSKTDNKKNNSNKATKSSTTTSASKLAKTSDPAAATGLATLFLSAVGSGLVTTGFARKRREKRQ